MTIRSIASLVVGLAALIAAAPAVAQKYDFTIQNAAVGSAPIEQPHPAYPSKLRSGQEGWVRVNYVITPDGKAVRPIVIDSVGGTVFEAAVIERLPEWRFEPPGEELSNNTTNIRFEMYRGREYRTNLLRKVTLEIVVNEDFLDRTIETSAERSRDAMRHVSSAARARDVG